MATTGPLFVTHALEALEPELRALLLSHSSSTKYVDGSGEDDAEIVSQCVRHVMSQAATGPKQQEAAIRAVQQLDTTAQRVDEELHAEIVSCNEQLLSTIAASADLSSELAEFIHGVRTLHASVTRMKLHASGPVLLLQRRVATLEKHDKTLTIITLLKRLSNQIRLFEAQFSQHLQRQQNSSQCSFIGLPKAGQSLHEIEELLESISQFADEISPQRPVHQNDKKDSIIDDNNQLIDNSLLSHFPMLESDLRWIRQNGKVLISIATDSLELGLTEQNKSQLMLACQVMLWYGSSEKLIEYLKPAIDNLIQSSLESFDIQVITNAVSPQSHTEGLEVSQEAAAIVWKALQQFLRNLEIGLQRCFALDQVLETLGHDEDLMNYIGSGDQEDALIRRICTALGSSKIDTNTTPISSIFWRRSLKEFQTQFRRLSVASQNFSQFILSECPRLSSIFNASAADISNIWNAELRSLAARKTGAAGNAVFGSLIMMHDDESVSQHLSALNQICVPIVSQYLDIARTNVIGPVKLLFSDIRDPLRTSVGFPTTSDIKVYVNAVVSELNRATPAQSVHAEVLKAVEESLVLCASRLRDLRDMEGMKIVFPTSDEISILPSATPGHRRNAKLHETCQTLCSSLLHVFGSDKIKSNNLGQQIEPSSVHVLPEYVALKKVLHLLLAMKETFVSNWFHGLQRFICEIHLLPLLDVLSVDHKTDHKIDHSNESDHMPMGSHILRNINEISGFISREYFSLISSSSLFIYGTALSRAVIQYFLAISVLIKPLIKESQRVALAAHLTSLEVTLSGFFCPKLRDVLSVEWAALKSFRRLLFLEGSAHFRIIATPDPITPGPMTTPAPISSEKATLHPEVSAVLQTLPSHLMLLHLLTRLPNSIPSISEFLGQSVSTSATDIAESFNCSAVRGSQAGLASPSVVRSKIKNILSKYTNEKGEPNDKHGTWTDEGTAIVLFMRGELGL